MHKLLMVFCHVHRQCKSALNEKENEQWQQSGRKVVKYTRSGTLGIPPMNGACENGMVNCFDARFPVSRF
jgi:hypothetical protein